MKTHVECVRQLRTLNWILLLGTAISLGTGCGGNETIVTNSSAGSGGSGTVATCQSDAQCLNGYTCAVGVCVKNQGGTGGASGAIAGTGGAANPGGATSAFVSASTYWYECDCACTFSNVSGTTIQLCPDPSSATCSSCATVCSATLTANPTYGSYISGAGSCALSAIPVQWACGTKVYGTGDGCDCGCGALDPDCASASATACNNCTDSGSCASGCSDISSTNNATCSDVPPGWHCSPVLYNSGDGCDCGCGIVDPDCTSSASSACAYCSNGGSCALSCAAISATNNAVCQ